MARYAVHLVTGADPVIWEGGFGDLLQRDDGDRAQLRPYTDVLILPSGSIVNMRHVVMMELLP
jgi:hypothetical protein